MKGSSWDGLLLGAKILRLRPLLSFDKLRRFVGRRWGGRLCERRGGWFWGSCEWQISTGQVVAWLMARYGSWELCMLCEIRPFVHLNNSKDTLIMISQLYLGCNRHDLHHVILSDLHPRKIWVYAFWTTDVLLCRCLGSGRFWGFLM